MKVGNSSALDAAFRAQEAAKAAAKEVAKQATAQALKTRDVFSPSPTSRFQQLFGATADGAAATWPKGPLAAGNSKPSADVSTMQSRLVALGFMKDPGTSAGLYGRTTIEAVRLFQLANGISPANGIATPATLAAMGATTAMSKSDVDGLQKELGDLGFLGHRAQPGQFDAATQRALINFQLANGISPPTGVLDDQTRAALASPTVKSADAAVAALDGQTVAGKTIGVAGDPPAPDAQSIAALPSTATVRGYPINCRSDASTTATSNGQFAASAPLTLTGNQRTGADKAVWYEVNGTGKDGKPLSGWVRADTITKPVKATDPRVDSRMQALGYLEPGGNTDAAAVKNFQVMNGLPETGVLDQATVDKMWSADAKMSAHIVQFQDPRFNPQKSKTTGNPNGDESCGPASVAMALDALGLATIDKSDPQVLVNKIRKDSGTVQGSGTGTPQVEAAAQKNGAQTYEVDTMDELILAAERGDPVVVYGEPNKGGTYYNHPASEGAINDGAGHWITVLGYDPKTKTFIVSDPLCRDGTLRLTADQLKAYVDFSEPSVALHKP